MDKPNIEFIISYTFEEEPEYYEVELEFHSPPNKNSIQYVKEAIEKFVSYVEEKGLSKESLSYKGASFSSDKEGWLSNKKRATERLIFKHNNFNELNKVISSFMQSSSVKNIQVSTRSFDPKYKKNNDYNHHLTEIVKKANLKAEALAETAGVKVVAPILMKEIELKNKEPNLHRDRNYIDCLDGSDDVFCDFDDSLEDVIEAVESNRTVTLTYKFIYEIG